MHTTLTISHNLFLTREERYAWYNGQETEVVGVSIPVWYHKNKSSEPAVEVFCKYCLTNKEDGILITHNDGKYEINIPKVSLKEIALLPDDVWKSLTPESQEQWTEANRPDPTLKMILDIKDGGAEYLSFRQQSKVTKGKKILLVAHFVEIKDMQELIQTLT